MSTRSALAVLAAGSLLLAGCGSDVAAGPQGALQERLDRGVSIEVTLEADPAGIEDADAAAGLQELLDDQAADGPLLVASRSGDGVARGVVLRGGDLEVRLVDDTAYLRADDGALDELSGGLSLPSPEDGDVDGGGAEDGELAPLALLGALDGGWVGVSGLTEEGITELMGGHDAEAPTDDDRAAVEELLAERDLDDLDGLVATYATVTGDGPWQVEVHARDLARALDDVATEVDAVLGGAMGTATPHGADDDTDGEVGPDHDVDDLPERVGGVTVDATRESRGRRRRGRRLRRT